MESVSDSCSHLALSHRESALFFFQPLYFFRVSLLVRNLLSPWDLYLVLAMVVRHTFELSMSNICPYLSLSSL